VCKFNKSSKGSTFVTSYADLLLPVRYADMHINVTYQSDKKFVDIHFEYCSSYNNLPPYASILFGVVKTFSKDLIQPCPYVPRKRLGVENFPVDSLSIFLTAYKPNLGNYKTSIYLYDRKGKLINFYIFYSSLSRKRSQKGPSSG